MLILQPLAYPTVWGGNRLLSCVTDYHEENIGQLYTASSVKEKSNPILNGVYQGKTFYEYYRTVKEKLGLDFEEYPLLIALVDAKEDLSVQVHPSDEFAKEVEKEPYGKIESWYFIEGPTDGTIIDGCKCKDMNEFNTKVKRKDFKHIIDTLDVKTDDYVFVESGTLHALGKGSLIYEVQETSDLTYRFYDYDRKDSSGKSRELHLAKATQAVDITKKSKTRSFSEEEIFEKKYAMKKFVGTKYKNENYSLEILTVFSGECEIDGIIIHRGMSIVLEPKEEVVFENLITGGVTRYLGGSQKWKD